MLELNDKECNEILSFFVVDSFNTSSEDGKKKRGSINIGLNYSKLQLYCIFFNLFRPEKQGKLQEIPGTLKVIIHKTSPEQPLQSRCPIEVRFFTTHLVCEKRLELLVDF